MMLICREVLRRYILLAVAHGDVCRLPTFSVAP
jgi:hypothetical protein